MCFSTTILNIYPEFEDKQKAMEDREVISTKCYLCHKNIRKKSAGFHPTERIITVLPSVPFMDS